MTDAIASLNAARAKGLGQVEPWPVPDWSVLGGAMADTPCLPLECFGKAAGYIKRAAIGTNAPPDYVAGMLIAAVSGLICKSVSVRINRSWYENLILWLILMVRPARERRLQQKRSVNGYSQYRRKWWPIMRPWLTG